MLLGSSQTHNSPAYGSRDRWWVENASDYLLLHMYVLDFLLTFNLLRNRLCPSLFWSDEHFARERMDLPLESSIQLAQVNSPRSIHASDPS